MREIIVTENVSVDGMIAPMDGWFDPLDSDEDLLEVSAGHRSRADALVLGRVTFEEFAGFWPHQDDDPTGVSAYLDAVAKYVVSTSLQRAGWENSTIVRDAIAAIAELKESPGKDVVITGSATLVRSLQASGLIDVYRLFVYPVVQGYGTRLMADGTSARLELRDSRVFSSGITLLEYRVVR